jgi:hypothetical protein
LAKQEAQISVVGEDFAKFTDEGYLVVLTLIKDTVGKLVKVNTTK